MSSNTLETAYANGQIIDASHINELTLALLGAFVGRDASGIPSPEQSLGTLAIPWGPLYCKSIIIDGLALDSTQITSFPNRIISGKTRALSAAPDFIRANGADLSFQVLGDATDLIVSINNTAVSVSTDLTKTGFTAAPASNNTCLVNDATLTNDKTVGEDGRVIIIDTVGSSVSALVGQIVAFKVGATSEIMIGYLRDATTITNALRGYFFDSSGNPLERADLSNNTSLTLLSLGWVFLEDNGTTVDVTYRTPSISFASPSSPATGYYWFDISNQVWKRYSGTAWEIIDRTLIGVVAADTTACIGSRSFDFNKQHDDFNNAFVVPKTSEIVEIKEMYSRIKVYGSELSFDHIKPSWNITTDLEVGLTEAISTTYYVYLSEKGKPIISTRKPYERPDLKGHYHPYESWRCIAKFYNNASSAIESVHQIGKTIDNFVGVVFDYAGPDTPDDCLRTDGSSLNRADYPELFNAIGTKWGTASGTTFNIPDLRGTFKRGWANGSTRDLDRAARIVNAAGGATGDNVGTYQANQNFSHSHNYYQGNHTGVYDHLVNWDQLANAHPVGGRSLRGSIGTVIVAEGGNEARPNNAYVNMVIKYR